MRYLTPVICLLFQVAGHAAPVPVAAAEINYLLSTVSNSDCRFYRNGTWYDAKSAAAHLRYKYENLAAKDLIRDAEDFIDKAATKSSSTGLAYAIKCPDAAESSSREWLRKLLALYRQSRPDMLSTIP